LKKIINIIGRSNSGKTTLITKLIEEYKKQNYSVAVLKSTSAKISMCDKKKDTEKFREAGSYADMISDGNKLVLHSVLKDNSPKYLIEKYFNDIDIVIVEGYKQEEFADVRLEVIGDKHNSPLFKTDIKGIQAIVTDEEIESSFETFKRNDILGIIKYVKNL